MLTDLERQAAKDAATNFVEMAHLYRAASFIVLIWSQPDSKKDELWAAFEDAVEALKPKGGG